MGDSIHASFLHRARHTPMRDILRGRLSGRLDWRARLAATELPEPARGLVERVVRHTRLWRSEQSAVADELSAHFRDALAMGEPIDAAIAEFGDERKASRLIRRAKKRNRPLIWHAMRWAVRGIEWLAVAYAAVTLIFFLSHPSPTVNYLDALNQPIVAIPQADRAWPAYRQLMLELTGGRPIKENGQWTRLPSWLDASAGDKDWPQAVAWLRAHQADLDTLRAATAKPVLGFVLGPDGSIDDPALWPGLAAAARREWAEFPSITAIPTPYTPCMRSVADVLRTDAEVARVDRDGGRVDRDVTAMLDLADQLRGNDEFYVDGLVALAIDKVALLEIERVLRADPKTLSDQQLIGLAHRIARPQSAADLFSLHVAQVGFHDTIQHAFTDDGRGNGHLTADGMRFLMDVNATRWSAGVPNEETNQKVRVLTNAFGPSLMLICASREQLLERYDRMMHAWESNLQLPLREITRDGPSAVLGDDSDSGRANLKFQFFDSLGISPRTYPMSVDSEKYLGRRDGVMTAIALELYRRHTGNYPKTLQEMVPAFLPAVPADRITGDPIKYKLVDGTPRLYSVGINRTDDGGHPAVIRGEPMPEAAAQWWPNSDQPVLHGDWILYPSLIDAPIGNKP